ncbi:hypothetical protein ACFOGI_06645 [Virgibacillus xinjiangensis]|uniref:Sporulation lipoprotein YhcN/YlaJ (Spore_YhcN_YlaJ) n=1 Tax=Virgibacillus xinjiangensis TaxID=393090 RepID=A0ABV7CUA8_9BACI
MKLWKAIILCSFLWFAAGCNTDNQQEGSTNDSIDMTQISSQNAIDQTPSNQAKERLSKHPEVTGVKAVNTSKHMLIGMEIEHMKRFQLAKFRKERTKEMKKHFSDMHVEFSTDQKILLELERIEKKLDKGKYSKKELNKELDKLIKLSKEQT